MASSAEIFKGSEAKLVAVGLANLESKMQAHVVPEGQPRECEHFHRLRYIKGLYEDLAADIRHARS